jgi:hypothetical protein
MKPKRQSRSMCLQVFHNLHRSHSHVFSSANAAQLSAVHARRGSFTKSAMVHDMNMAFMQEVAKDKTQRKQVEQYSEAMSGLSNALHHLRKDEDESDADEEEHWDSPPAPSQPSMAAPAPAAGSSFLSMLSPFSSKAAAPPVPSNEAAAESKSSSARSRKSGKPKAKEALSVIAFSHLTFTHQFVCVG